MSAFQRAIDRELRELAAVLAGSDIRIATAESCTGGQLAALLAGDTRLGPHLERGFVVYSAPAKIEMLGVDADDVARCDAVNPEVAAGLACGALERSGADIAVAITGFCGPQQDEEEVGLVYLSAAARSGKRLSETHHFGDIGREFVLASASAAALALTARIVRDHRASMQPPEAGRCVGVRAATAAPS